MKKEDVKGYLLEDYWEACYSAHRWISFSPDKRATQYVIEFSNVLESDLKELGENQGNYKEKFIKNFLAWMNAKGNCASSVITGGSGFNVRRAEKMNSRENGRMNDFYHFREKYFKAVNRVKTPSPEEELDSALEKLDRLSNLQQMMKDANSLLRKMRFTDLSKDEIEQQITHKMNEEEYPEDIISKVIWNGNNGYGYSFPSFTLTNNNAKIKGAQTKVTVMKNRIETKDSFEDIKFDGGYITIQDDRVKIFHDEKPEREVIQKIKSNGFRWSPHLKCWCRKHTQNALIVARQLVSQFR